MHLLDANILIYAFRSDSPQHAACYGWLTRALTGEEPVATTSVVELALSADINSAGTWQGTGHPGGCF